MYLCLFYLIQLKREETHSLDTALNLATLGSSWLTPRKKEVFWPPYMDQARYDRALKNGEAVDCNSWELCKLSRIEHLNDTVSVNPGTYNTCSGSGATPINTSNLQSVNVPLSNFVLLSDQIEKLVTLVAHVKEQNTEILSWISKQSSSNSHLISRGLPDLPVKFPLVTEEEINELDNHLKQNEDHTAALCLHLSALGGKDIPTKTNRILKQLLADSLANRFNYYGKRSQKRAFSSLLLKNVIVRAVQISVPKSTEKEVEDAIKIWLKHAADRMKKRSHNE